MVVVCREVLLYMEKKAVTLAARGPHRKELTHILSRVSRFAIETLSFSKDTDMIDFSAHTNP